MPTQLEPEIKAAFMQNIPTKNYPKFLTLFGRGGQYITITHNLLCAPHTISTLVYILQGC